ncbi:MAG: adenosylcobinamide-phosphate synthase CbiB [Sporomusaceae bacterium]|nr:adenosylcobinamide-phosphate synthase CbiB [Sporomusaceae bacterium]
MSHTVLNQYSWFFLLPLGAVLFDTLLGDPRSRLHPVVLIGNFIGLLEKILRRPKASAGAKRAAGAVLVGSVLAVTYTVVFYICSFLALLEPWETLAGEAMLLSFAISPRSLAEAGNGIKNLLLQNKLKEARKQVGWIVGRDTDRLSTPEVTRATVETVAENIVDGIISPLFYAIIGGVPLAFLYRAVNTLDSMVGYKNEKYLDFGMVAARVDDIFNFFPARITGLLLLAAALLTGFDSKAGLKMWLRDARKHPSPNSGIPESIVSGALHVRLGGINYYGGVASHRAFMGDAKEVLGPGHIAKTIRLMYVATFLFVLGYGLLAWLTLSSSLSF